MRGLPPFQRFLDEHTSDVWRFLVATVGPQEAEDCFQETFLAALRAYPRLHHGRNLRAWIFTIAHSKAMDAHRKKAREPVPVEHVPDRMASRTDNGDPSLWRAVRDLPDKQCAAVAHRFVSDLAYKDIAGAMSCTEEAARQNVHEGIKRLREVLAR
jgi:RNA polymerase sigma factor (sigma-70 family)